MHSPGNVKERESRDDHDIEQRVDPFGFYLDPDVGFHCDVRLFSGRKEKIRELQKYYSNVKEDGFQYSTNDGPDPCKNDAEIETCEIRGMSGTMLLDEKGYV